MEVGAKEKNMKTYYCVTILCDEKGKETASITSITKAEDPPENTMISTPKKTMIWFSDEKAAKECIKQVQKGKKITLKDKGHKLWEI